MIKSLTFLLLLACLPTISISQQFFRTGSPDNVDSIPEFGLLLAGGSSDNDDGMRWLAEKANGGDVVVLRASGSDGYNNYIYSGLGVHVNSVTSILITSSAQAENPEVCEAVENAEVIFIAGGNQWNYYSHWKGTCLQEALNNHVQQKGGAIGGTSAGLAILGEVVYTAEKGTVLTTQALNDPFHRRMTLANDFLAIPFMENIVTDSHYNNIYSDNNNRHGRHMAFMARMITDWQMDAKGIGVNEYTAVGVEQDGTARVFGHPGYDDFAYFHMALSEPEVCEEGQPLHWYNDQNAVAVYRIKGDFTGTHTFNLNNWQEGNGGEWFRWYVDEGELMVVAGEPVNVEPLPFNTLTGETIHFYPNPARDFVTIESVTDKLFSSYSIYDVSGRLIKKEALEDTATFTVNLSGVKPGAYILKVRTENQVIPLKILRK
ncbi:MAG: T9SS C-terminal target domain-containing protein [Bacteroidetes bacterium]|nr:MAG: T9SS C-terminal target domain-containing protein [Bacteroidota bacterium]